MENLRDCYARGEGFPSQEEEIVDRKVAIKDEEVTAPLEGQCKSLFDSLIETGGVLEDILGTVPSTVNEEPPSQGSLDRIGTMITRCRAEASFILKQVMAIRHRLAE